MPLDPFLPLVHNSEANTTNTVNTAAPNLEYEAQLAPAEPVDQPPAQDIIEPLQPQPEPMQVELAPPPPEPRRSSRARRPTNFGDYEVYSHEPEYD
ncbi:hypothetical protein M0R45_028437 [Rubus argutus]|uniref:Uncharacterized protein n=1 Tax=Rubus argutus TaxID=59490 RepID=A0AAW1W790_RUBAR